jgi:hypothetical protein
MTDKELGLADLMEFADWSVSDIEAVDTTLSLLLTAVGDSRDGERIVKFLRDTSVGVTRYLEKRQEARESAMRSPNVRLLFPEAE